MERNFIHYQNSQDSNKPVVFITGCGSGLGFALAKMFYESRVYRTVITFHRKSDLEVLLKRFPETEDFLIRQLDVTNVNQRELVVAEVYRKWRAIDILINNAGVSYRSVIEHMDESSELHQMDVNYLSPMALIRLVIPGMREKAFGRIINVSSVSGMVAIPTMASYSASKHALEGATEALWYELRPFGIGVSLVQPGFIRSNSFEKVHFSKKAQLSLDLDGPYADYYENMGPFVARFMHASNATPESIAKNVFKLCACRNPPLWVPVTFDAKLFFWVRKFMPRRLFHKFMYSFLPKINFWGIRYKKKSDQGFKVAL